MEEERKELFSQKVFAGRRTYYMDLCKSRDGAHYVVISESRLVGKEFKRDSVRIFEEHLDAFIKGLEQIRKFMVESSATSER
ncbi:MAG: DUF3276 family protein [Thermoflexales bacterium]